MKPDPRLARMNNDLGLVFPPLQSGRRSVIAETVRQLDQSQWLPRDVIAKAQFKQLARTAQWLARHHPLFVTRLQLAGLEPDDLATPEGLAQFPPLSRIDVQGFDWKTQPPIPKGQGPAMLYNTSGSTGEPVRVWRTAACRLLWLAMTLRFHLWGEPDFSGRLAAIRANLKQFGTFPHWGSLVADLFPCGPGLLVDIESDIAEQYRLFDRFKPESLLIYPSNLDALLDHMEAHGLSLPSLKRLRTMGETLSSELTGRATSQTGAQVIDCYSSEEIGYLAMQCPDNAELYHVMSEGVILEIVDEDGKACAPGEIGRVLITDYLNHAAPMIRYDLGDHAEAAGPCDCGRGLPTLKRVMGRTRNMIVKPDGTRHWPLTGYKQFRDIAPIRQYQFRQHEHDRIEVRLFVERPLTGQEEAVMVEHLHWKLRYPYRLDFKYYSERLPTGPNGKFEEFLSLLPA